jgi:hypothetical protein
VVVVASIGSSLVYFSTLTHHCSRDTVTGVSEMVSHLSAEINKRLPVCKTELCLKGKKIIHINSLLLLNNILPWKRGLEVTVVAAVKKFLHFLDPTTCLHLYYINDVSLLFQLKCKHMD